MKQAVLTADVIDSQNITDMNDLFSSLSFIIHDISEQLPIKISYETYRGDSFQIAMDPPEMACLVAVIIRAGLRAKMGTNLKSTKLVSIKNLWDVRFSIGVGEGELSVQSVVESNGPVHVLSGTRFDLLKKKQTTFLLSSLDTTLNDQMEVLSKLMETIVLRWSNLSAEAIYYVLLHKKTQQELATILHVTQPAIHKRLDTANIDAISLSLNYISQLIAQ
ncbi:MAG: hypothetical protein COB98_02120 [Flavobacteriaceae bacterium]|nr:MAG: hypothetical protein COB98_02120 [Flavobacteriaceae bacterium]